VTPAIDTPLGKALRAHRVAHQDCGLGCREYLAITDRATAERRIYEGPVHGHSWLSVREAVNV
jgi:hypothetical protein